MEFEVFADESYVKLDKSNKPSYVGIGALFIPLAKKEKLSKKLTNSRCLNQKSDTWFWDSNDCPRNCKYHQYNNTEIHFKDLERTSSKAKRDIAKKWLDILLHNNRQDLKSIYFNILYIDLNKIDENYFNNDKTRNNIYNRFFRTVVGALANYLDNERVIIKNIYHDQSSDKSRHDYFPWHCIEKININIGSLIFSGTFFL